MRVGVLDDNEDIVALVAMALSDHEVVAHTSPNSALADPDFLSCDVIVLDWMMPELSGRDVIASLECPVIVYTAGGHADEARAAGAAVVIDKGHSIVKDLVPTVEAFDG